LATSKPRYGEIITAEKKLSDEAEKILKEALVEYKKTFLASV
jgi:F-type H+-transporting ATPase subunit alpha